MNSGNSPGTGDLYTNQTPGPGPLASEQLEAVPPSVASIWVQRNHNWQVDIFRGQSHRINAGTDLNGDRFVYLALRTFAHQVTWTNFEPPTAKLPRLRLISWIGGSG